MSELIDDVVKSCVNENVLIENKWYLAKPIVNKSLLTRIKDAYLCLTGKATAVHFKQDELKTYNKTVWVFGTEGIGKCHK